MRSKPRWLAVAFALAAIAINQRGALADQDITLPTPIYLENFDELAELALPPGWTVQNQTDTVTAGQDIDDLKSDTYKDWVVITADRITNLKSRVMQFNPTTVNGVTLDALATGNLIYAESDVRGGNQYQNLYTSDYDLTGKTNVYLVFNSLYEQNQDNINGLEYSIDGGATWIPGLYYLYGGKDIITHDRQTVAAFYVDGVLKSTVPIAGDGDIDSFTGATYIGQDGTGGYGFNNDTDNHFKDIFIDDFGLWRRTLTAQEVASIYAHGLQGEDLTKASGEVVVLPPNVTTGPVSQVVNAGGSFTLSATVDGTAPFTYQWQKNSNDIAGATSAAYTANNVDASAAGNYRVIVTNSKGSSTSSNAKIAVATGTLGSELVAYVKLNGDYNDASGRGNNATAKGSPTFEAGKFGQAMRFTTVKDGSKIDYASFGKPADLNFGDATDFSVSMWVNWSSSEDDLPFISNKDWNSSNNTGWGAFSQDNGHIRTQLTGTPSGSANKISVTATPDIHDGKWHHVVVTFWRGVVASTYVDGQIANTASLSAIVGSVDAGLNTNIAQDGNGTYTDGGGVLMTGLIDDLAIWRRVVTATETASIFSAGQGGGDLASLLGGSSAGPEIINVSYANGNLTFHVSANGTYQAQTKASLTDATWTNVGAPVSNGTFTVPASGKAGFFRLQQQ